MLSGKLLVAPGVFDSLSARISASAGAEIVYMSGGGSSMTVLGKPDAELLGMSEMASHGQRMCGAVDVPVIADADTGYGNPMSVMRTVGAYEQAGLAGLHLEDQHSPKRCGHLAGKTLVSASEFALKLRAAVHARRDQDFLLIARTDSRAFGMDEVLERVRRYADTGIDMIFPEGLQSVEEVSAVHQATGLPVLINQVPQGRSRVLDHGELLEAGSRIVIYPSALISASVLAMESAVSRLLDGSLDPTESLAPAELFERVGLTEWLRTEEQFAAPEYENTRN